MLDQTTRQAILTLREAGHGTRAIAAALHISRGAVKAVVRDGGAAPPPLERDEQLEAVRDEILALHASCKGNFVRVHEELVARRTRSTLSYPALTAVLHGGILASATAPPLPKGSYDDVLEPGEEMQHDTSPHDADIGGAVRRVQTASLVLCHSHVLFFQFYPRFTRFDCKVFLTEAVQYVGGACKHCMIDNSHVIVLRGTGKEMVPVPEMEAFGRRLHFKFIAHEKGDANRSARVERPFHFIETNFLAGRKFADFAAANREARAWCDKVNASYMKHLRAPPRAAARVVRRRAAPDSRPLPIPGSAEGLTCSTSASSISRATSTSTATSTRCRTSSSARPSRCARRRTRSSSLMGRARSPSTTRSMGPRVQHQRRTELPAHRPPRGSGGGFGRAHHAAA